MKNVLTRICAMVCVSAAEGAMLAACGSGSSADTVTVEGDVPLAYVKRSTALSMNPTDGSPSAGGRSAVRRRFRGRQRRRARPPAPG